jgi:hypothetical protein
VCVAAFAYAVIKDLSDEPRDMDVSGLDPLIVGTTIIDEPYRDCPQGREPIGDCVTVARVGPRAAQAAVDVIAENAEREGFSLIADPEYFVLEAVAGDRCLAVSEVTGPMAGLLQPGSVNVYLRWC